jgi:hypothetical protein
MLFLWLGLIMVIGIAFVAVTILFAPQESDHYAVALQFMEAAGKGDDDTAFALLSDDMQAYVRENCPDGSVSACIEAYIPDDWGRLLSTVFRRAAPDGENWDVQLIATYAENEGFSGVCIYHRMERDETGAWKVFGWAGFISCGDSASRDMANNPDAPNRAP